MSDIATLHTLVFLFLVKLDSLKITEQKPKRTNIPNALKLLEQKLRRFFDEADGHGSLIRKPPPAMITPQYFKVSQAMSCYPIRRMDWIALVNSTNYKKKFASAGISNKQQSTANSNIPCGKSKK